jgi:cytochrome c oxidase cbb3-type subunit 1
MARLEENAMSTATSDRETVALERARIDASARVPVLLFFGTALFWLLAGTLLALAASMKLHMPGFLTGHDWLTFGRVRPAHVNAVIYGWGSLCGFAVIVWLMARLSWAEVRYPSLLVAGGILWNVGVTVGTIAILAGQGTSVEYLEYPIYVPPILVAGYALIAVWSMVIFRDRREKEVYVSQWYLMGAMFWLPWLYITSNLLLFWFPVHGVVQASVLWWYGHTVMGLWFTPLGLAAIYYLIPKVIGRPIYSYYLGIIGFWSLALFYVWLGSHHLVGGPFPAWLITAGIVGSLMMFIPVGATAINHHMTMIGHFGKLKYSPTLRFVVFGAMSYTAVSVEGSLEALRDVNQVTKFTHFTIGHSHLGMYAFFSMAMFGAMYYIVPRLTGWEWASTRLIRWHFWCTAIGVFVYVALFTWGGWFQGVMLHKPAADGKPVPFMDVVQYTRPYLIGRSVAGGLIGVGHLAFTVLFVLNVMRYGVRRDKPTLMHEEPAPKVEQPALATATV